MNDDRQISFITITLNPFYIAVYFALNLCQDISTNLIVVKI